MTRFHIAPLFIVMVVLPTAAAAFYYLIIAAPIYVSEARFIVHSPSHSQPAALGSVLQGVGLDVGSADPNAFAVEDYMTSRDAVADLEQHHNLREVLSRPLFDFWARVPRPLEGHSFEALYHDYARFVSVGNNSTTGITTLNVKAFNPKDASDIANALLNGGENLINRLNARADSDAITEAGMQISEAQTRVIEAERKLTDFRNQERLIDPTRSSAVDLELQGKLEVDLASLRAQRTALAESAPQSPQLPLFDRQISAYEAQVASERSKMAGQATSLAPLIGQYERLTMEREFAAKELADASIAVQSARVEARRKRLYLERIVEPNTPDAATQPRRLYSIFMVFITTLAIYGATVLVRAGFKEHGQS